MKLHFQRLIMLAFLLVTMLIPVHAYAVNKVVIGESLTFISVEESETTQEEAPTDPLPEINPEAPYQERLEDIQVLLMYLCGIAIFWTFVGCGMMLYRFFNMFF